MTNNKDRRNNNRDDYHEGLNVTPSFMRHVDSEVGKGTLLTKKEYKEGYVSPRTNESGAKGKDGFIISEQGYSNTLHITGNISSFANPTFSREEVEGLHVTLKKEDNTKVRTGFTNPNLNEWARKNDIPSERFSWVTDLQQTAMSFNMEEGEGGLKKNDGINYEQKMKNYWERQNRESDN